MRSAQLDGSLRDAALRTVVLSFLLGCAVGSGVVPVLAQGASHHTGRASDPTASLDGAVEKALRSWGAPGLALVVVRDDAVFTRAYGVTAQGGDEAVDASTLFAVGSLTKAFTSTLLAMLVDEGQMSWDEPVSTYLPDFQMHDPYVTRHLTIRDVLSHRTGLAGNDLMWAAGSVGPEDLIHRLRFQEPALGFRAGLGYHNVMYLLAGELAAEVTGKPWEVLVRERIFEPLKMERSTTDVGELRTRSNVALPHAESGPGQLLGTVPSVKIPLDAADTVKRVEWFDPVTTPAGGIGSSAVDFGRWLRLHLGAGQVEGRRLVSEDALLVTRTPQVPSPGFPRSQSEAAETNLSAYGMGWNVRDYRGRLMLSHLGSTPGWGSAVALLPGERIGAAVFVNVTEGLWLADAVTKWILDRHLGAEPKDWNEQALSWAVERRQAGRMALERAEASRVDGTRPSLPIAAYAGTYLDSLRADALDGNVYELVVTDIVPYLAGRESGREEDHD